MHLGESKVEGVSRVFLCMDFFGSIFSSISLGKSTLLKMLHRLKVGIVFIKDY